MILAAQYYRAPFPERKYWKHDLEQMKASGLNAVQLWVMWSWVESEPGFFDFSDYDDLADEAEKLGAELIVMGSHRHGVLYHLFLGSTSESVLRRVPCPVLIVPSPTGDEAVDQESAQASAGA